MNPAWGDDDDEAFLATIDVEEQIKQALARRQQAAHRDGQAQQPLQHHPNAPPQPYQHPAAPLYPAYQQPQCAPAYNAAGYNPYPPANAPPPSYSVNPAYTHPGAPHPAAGYHPHPPPQHPYPPPPSYATYPSHHGMPPPYMQQPQPQQPWPPQPQGHQSYVQPPLPQQQPYPQQHPGGSTLPAPGIQSAAAPAPAQPAAPALITIHASLELVKPSVGSGPAAMAPQTSRAEEPTLEVKMGWHDAASTALKELERGSWDAKRRCWLFPLSSHDAIIEALQAVSGVRIVVEPLNALPSTVLKVAAHAGDDSALYARIPAALEEQLMPFQREGVKFGLSRGGRCLVGDEMGLGKTVQAIALAAAYKEDWPGLIIAPSSLREQWAEALHRWLGVTEDRVHVVHSGKDAANVPPSIDFLVVSYNFVQKMDLVKRFNLVICDESHYIKDGSAQRTKAVIPVLKEARRAILLTGTPALNRPKEIYTQLASLLPRAKLTMKAYGERYCHDEANRFDRYAGARNLDELHSLLRATVMVRRLKADVLTQLPSKRRQQIFLTLDGGAKRQLTALQREMEELKAGMARVMAVNAASAGAANIAGSRMSENKALMEMYHTCAELKAGAVQEYVGDLLAAGQKFIIFGHHKVLLDAIEHTCNRAKGCKFIRIDGSTPPASRTNLVNTFQQQEDVKVAILGIKAAGVGLTLTAASLVIFAELTWTPGEIIQAEDRAHRIGQASAVNVQFLHIRQSVDDIIWAAVQHKLENLGHAIDGRDQAMELGSARNMPERGQTHLDAFVTQHPQQGRAGNEAANGAPGTSGVSQISGGASPTVEEKRRAQQASLLNYFPQQPAVVAQQPVVGGKRPLQVDLSQDSW